MKKKNLLSTLSEVRTRDFFYIDIVYYFYYLFVFNLLIYFNILIKKKNGELGRAKASASS